jgi:hypothetical protein
MTKKITLKKVDRPIDGFSSVSVKVNLANEKPELAPRLLKVKWEEFLQVEVEGMNLDTDFTFKFDTLKGELFLTLNFTKDGKIETLNVQAKNNVVLTSPNRLIPEIKTPDYLLSKDKATLQIVARKNEEAETIKKYSGKGGIDF